MRGEGALQQAVWLRLDGLLEAEYDSSELEPLIIMDVVAAMRQYQQTTGQKVLHRPVPERRFESAPSTRP